MEPCFLWQQRASIKCDIHKEEKKTPKSQEESKENVSVSNLKKQEERNVNGEKYT